MTKRIAGNSLLRQQNQNEVLVELKKRGSASRIELARATGLNKATISNIVNELIRTGKVIETGESDNARVGRREVYLEINPQLGFYATVLINSDNWSIYTTNTNDVSVAEFSETVSASLIPARIKNLLPAFLQNTAAISGDLLGLTFGSGENPQDDLFEWAKENITENVVSENRARLKALGEANFGAAQDAETVFYMTCETEVDAALIQNGELYSGAYGLAGSVAHLTAIQAGNLCICGKRGCLAAEIGSSALVAASGNGARRGGRSPRDVLEIMRSPEAAAALERQAVAAADVLDAVCRILDPAIIVLDGFFRDANGFLVPMIESKLGGRSIKIKVASLQNSAALGAALLMKKAGF